MGHSFVRRINTALRHGEGGMRGYFGVKNVNLKLIGEGLTNVNDSWGKIKEN